MATDLAMDFVTRDFVDDGAGAWLETEDSRTAVLMQLEIRQGTGYGDDDSGSRLAELREREEVASLQEIADETLRALQKLVDAGIIANLVVEPQPDPDEAGRGVIVISYFDRTTGRPVDIPYAPWGGSPR